MDVPVMVQYGYFGYGNWKQMRLVILEQGYQLLKLKDNKNDNDVIPFGKVKIIDGKKLHFTIKVDEEESHHVKAYTKMEKDLLMTHLTQRIKVEIDKTAFSQEFEKYRTEIGNIASQYNKRFELITVIFMDYINCFCEMTNKLNDMKLLIKDLKSSRKPKFELICNNLMTIKETMKRKFDDVMKNIYDYRDAVDPEYLMNANLNMNINMGNLALNNMTSTIISNTTNMNTDIPINGNGTNGDDNLSRKGSLLETITSRRSSFLIEKRLSMHQDEDPKTDIERVFALSKDNISHPDYSFVPRETLPKEIKASSNMIGEIMKSLLTKKAHLPIYFNEPISILQKNCEKFFYTELLDQAASCDIKEMQICYIAAFIIGEVALQNCRILKPFTPFLGETYEFVDNSKSFRIISEQVSIKPNIAAFMAENNHFISFGDTRNKTSNNFFKGVGMEFSNKSHLIFKNKDKDYYVHDKPNLWLKGLTSGKPFYDFSGTVCISHVNDSTITGEITFIEQTKKDPIGSFKGKVCKNGKTVYILKGNWTTHFACCLPDNTEEKVLLKMDELPNHSNNFEKYVMPSYAYRLNQLTDELKEKLPPSDSRLRPDMREYEHGSIEIAQAFKTKGEENQDKIKNSETYNDLKPNYFDNIYNRQSGDFVYQYKGGYWEDREKHNFAHLPNVSNF